MMIQKKDFMQLAIGNKISYYLRSTDLPKNPYQLWHGRAINIDLQKYSVLVTVLDQGFEGEIEGVEWGQIVTIEPSHAETIV